MIVYVAIFDYHYEYQQVLCVASTLEKAKEDVLGRYPKAIANPDDSFTISSHETVTIEDYEVL